MNNAAQKLTPKQAAFVQQIVDNKKISLTDAAQNAYGHKTKEVAAMTGSRLMRNDKIISVLDQHNTLIESAIIGTIKDWSKSQNTRRREVALDAAKYTHDKIHGKATQRVEQQSVSVEIAVDLT